MHVHLITFYTVIFLSSTTRTNQQLVAKANLVQVQQQQQQQQQQAQQQEEEEEEEEEENDKKDTNQHETKEHPRLITNSSTTSDSDVGAIYNQHHSRKGLHTFNSSSSQGGILHRVPKHENIKKPKYSSIVSESRRKEEEEEDGARESLRLDSISLSDRWTWILSKSVTVVGEDDHDYKQYQITPFAQLLMDQHYHPHYHHPHSPQHHHHHHHHNIRGSGSTKHRKIAQEGTTLYSISWSILLTTLTILTMTCLTSLSSLLYRTLKLTPSSSNTTALLFSQWKTISQVLPTLFSSESETVDKIKRYIRKKILPKSLETMEKMILMEIWRTFWLHTFRLARTYFQYIVGGSYYDSIWECYAPGWLRRGVRSVFVKKVQGSLQRILYGWITKGWEVVSIGFGYGWLDYEMIQDGQVSTGSSCDEESAVGGGIGEGGTVSLSDGSSVQESEQQGHHEMLDDMDMDLEMEFEDGLMSSEQQDNDFDNDEGDFDDLSDIQEEDGANDDDFMNDDISVACPDDQEC